MGERLGCLGNCKWQGGSEGRCTLSTLETLLSFTGEDCPFAIFFQRHFGCANLGNKTMCNGEQTLDGLPRCEWAKGMCQPHPMALEFDLLQSLGVDPLTCYIEPRRHSRLASLPRVILRDAPVSVRPVYRLSHPQPLSDCPQPK